MKFDTIDVRTEHDLDIIVSDIPNYTHIKEQVLKFHRDLEHTNINYGA